MMCLADIDREPVVRTGYGYKYFNKHHASSTSEHASGLYSYGGYGQLKPYPEGKWLRSKSYDENDGRTTIGYRKHRYKKGFHILITEDMISYLINCLTRHPLAEHRRVLRRVQFRKVVVTGTQQAYYGTVVVAKEMRILPWWKIW